MTLTRTAFALVGLLALPVLCRAATDVGDQAAAVAAVTPGARTSAAQTTPEAVESSRGPTTEGAGPNSFRTLFKDLGGDFKHLPSKDSAIVASLGAGLALAVHPLDANFNQKLARDADLFQAGDIAGNTLVLMGTSSAMYLFGRAYGANKVAHEGLDLLRAQIVTEAMVQSLKLAVQRPRPNGGSGYSFPSGHAAVTFATAVALDRHEPWPIAVPVYGLATYVAASRLHNNVHNLSDVVFGAALGTIAGRTVTRHVVPGFTMMPTPTPGGVAVMFTRTPKAS